MTIEERIRLCEDRVMQIVHDAIIECGNDLEAIEHICTDVSTAPMITKAIKENWRPSERYAAYARYREEFGDILAGRVCPPEKAKMEEGS